MSNHVRHRARGQPGRDRLPGDPDAAAARYPVRGRVHRPGRGRPARGPGRPGRAPGPGARLPVGRRRGRARPGGPGRRPSIPATASWPRTRRSPRPARRPGSPSSARQPRPSRRWATRSGPSRPWPRRACRWCPDPIRARAGLDDEALARAVAEIGYPVLLKPSAGGGGKGMREVHRAEDLADAISSARREARGSFGDDTLLVERLVTDPRHIEIQVLADAHGNVIHLGERECSLQRRHQKIIEEAPSPLLERRTAGGDGRRRGRGGPRGRLRRGRDGGVHRRAATGRTSSSSWR